LNGSERSWTGAVVLVVGVLSTLARAEPTWAGEPLQLRSGRHSAPDAWELFTSAEEPATPSEPSLLLCRIDVSTEVHWDLFADPDLAVRLRLGKSDGYRQHYLYGSEGSHTTVVSIPAVRLARDDRLQLGVFDRDVTTDEQIGSSEVRYEGRLPLQFRGRYFTAECRMASPERVQESLGAVLANADRIISQVERTPVQLHQPSAGYPDTGVGLARDALRVASALAGWAGAAIEERVRRLDAFKATWARARAHAVQEAETQLLPCGAAVELIPGVSAAVTAESCAARRGCVVALEVRNGTSAPVPLVWSENKEGLLTDVELLTEGATVVLAPSPQPPLAAGGTRKVVLKRGRPGGACVHRPRLLRVGQDGLFLRLTP